MRIGQASKGSNRHLVPGSWLLVLMVAALLALTGCEGVPGLEPAATATPRPPYADFDDALATAEALGDPQARAAALFERGNARFDAGDYEGAIADYDRAVTIDAGLARAYNNRALAYQALGQDDKALADFGAAIGADPNYIRAYKNRLALLERIGGDLRLRADDYGALARLEPDAAASYQYQRGVALRRADDETGARAAYDAAITADATFVDAYFERALSRVASGDNAGALADLDQAISLSPKAANAYYTRALVLSLNGEYQRAVEDATRALELRNNTYPAARLVRADALLALGETQRASDDLLQLDVATLDPALQDVAAQLKQRLAAP